MTKYGNTPQEFEGLKFDSKWELEVYLFLRRYIPSNHILVHQKIIIKPKTRNYPAKYWRCDFVIIDTESNPLLLVEAKGIPTKDFCRQLQLIDSNYPHILDDIRIVQTKQTRIDERFKSVTCFDLIPELKIISFHINYSRENHENKNNC
jgi:hypothetical protein